MVTAENACNERMSQVDKQIIARHGDRLGTANNASAMFMVSSKFNRLSLGQRYVLSLLIVISLLNDTRVDSWCDTGVPR